MQARSCGGIADASGRMRCRMAALTAGVRKRSRAYAAIASQRSRPSRRARHRGRRSSSCESRVRAHVRSSRNMTPTNVESPVPSAVDTERGRRSPPAPTLQLVAVVDREPGGDGAHPPPCPPAPAGCDGLLDQLAYPCRRGIDARRADLDARSPRPGRCRAITGWVLAALPDQPHPHGGELRLKKTTGGRDRPFEHSGGTRPPRTVAPSRQAAGVAHEDRSAVSSRPCRSTPCCAQITASISAELIGSATPTTTTDR